MHRIFCTTYRPIYDLEQKVAQLAEKILHPLNGRAQTKFYDTTAVSFILNPWQTHTVLA